jgi:hypothetical protein
MLTEFLLEGLPGAELVHEGLMDLADGREKDCCLFAGPDWRAPPKTIGPYDPGNTVAT